MNLDSPTVESWERGASYERGIPAHFTLDCRGCSMGLCHIQGYLIHKKTPTPLAPPSKVTRHTRHRPTVGTYGGAFLCK